MFYCTGKDSNICQLSLKNTYLQINLLRFQPLNSVNHSSLISLWTIKKLTTLFLEEYTVTSLLHVFIQICKIIWDSFSPFSILKYLIFCTGSQVIKVRSLHTKNKQKTTKNYDFSDWIASNICQHQLHDQYYQTVCTCRNNI